jgi:D-alanyl-D-alanine carboxypeptidase
MCADSGKRRRQFWFPEIGTGAVCLLVFLWLGGPAQAAEAASGCMNGPSQAAAQNAASLDVLPLNLFGRAETGWAFYEPLTANEIGTECPAASPGFARALADWQTRHGFSGAGVMTVQTLSGLTRLWQGRRPFVMSSRHQCPEPPPEQSLAQAAVSESYGGKTIQLRPDVLAAYRQLVAAARTAGVLPPGNLLTIFSAYRSPAYDAERCAREHNCQGVVRAACSAHRTGYAMDVYVGAAPGYSPDSSADANRLYISKGTVYRWLVKNAARFGFTNYPFEPWHWEFSASNSLQ